jgi:molybdopterin-guanine dinucleotide biosynthesis protein A
MENVTAVILAGGGGSRMQGSDKGLVELAGRPMIAHVIAAIQPQVHDIIISANRNLAQYRQLGLEVVSDEAASFEGPLAGLRRAMSVCTSPLLACVPCDAPLLPRDLVERLAAALHAQGTRAAVAHDGQRLQPLFGLFATNLLDNLDAYLQQGDRKTELWIKAIPAAVVDFSHEADAFRNINTPADISAMEAEMGGKYHAD